MKYTSIKRLLKLHIAKNLNTIWNWDIENQNFICLYETFDHSLPIYTSQQLLDKINEEETKQENIN